MGSNAAVTAAEAVNTTRLVNGCIIRGVDRATALKQKQQLQQLPQQHSQQQNEPAASPGAVELAICDDKGAELNQNTTLLQVGVSAQEHGLCHNSEDPGLHVNVAGQLQQDELSGGSNWVPLAWAPECVQVQCNRQETEESDEDIEMPRDRRLNAQLQELLLARIRRERRLWHDCDDYERRLRSRCLRDQLCRKAEMKWAEAILGFAGGWDEFLRTSNGHRRVLHWAERKIKETVDREASKRRRIS